METGVYKFGQKPISTISIIGTVAASQTRSLTRRSFRRTKKQKKKPVEEKGGIRK